MVTLANARLESWQAKASEKEGLYSELKIGAFVSPQETDALGLGHVVALASDYETVKARLLIFEGEATLTTHYKTSKAITFRYQRADRFQLTLDPETESVHLQCVIRIGQRDQRTEQIAAYWDSFGTALASLVFRPDETPQGDSVKQAAMDLTEPLMKDGIDSVTFTVEGEEPVTITKDDAKRMRGKK